MPANVSTRSLLKSWRTLSQLCMFDLNFAAALLPVLENYFVVLP